MVVLMSLDKLQYLSQQLAPNMKRGMIPGGRGRWYIRVDYDRTCFKEQTELGQLLGSSCGLEGSVTRVELCRP